MFQLALRDGSLEAMTLTKGKLIVIASWISLGKKAYDEKGNLGEWSKNTLYCINLYRLFIGKRLVGWQR